MKNSDIYHSCWRFVAAAIDHILLLGNDLRSMSLRQGLPAVCRIPQPATQE